MLYVTCTVQNDSRFIKKHLLKLKLIVVSQPELIKVRRCYLMSSDVDSLAHTN